MTTRAMPASSDRSRPSLPPVLSGLALAVLIAAYLVVALRPSSQVYLDYVDGYYLYIARRMAQGAVLYRQLMGVQPPGFYLLGDALFRLHEGLATARCYAALLHAATVLLVFSAVRRIGADRVTAVTAALLYSVAPYSLVWSRLFDPNPLVTCLGLAACVALLGRTTRWAAIAGIAGALALAVKVWYIPAGLGMALFLCRHRRDLLASYVLPLCACLALVLAGGTLSAGSAFWQGLAAQDASGLSASWLLAAVYDVVQKEWPLLLLAWVGVSLSRRADCPEWLGRTECLSLMRTYLAGSVVVLGATVKVGTFAPVFQFAEPALAIFAALFLGYCRRRILDAVPGATRLWSAAMAAILLVGSALLALPSLAALQSTPDTGVRKVTAAIVARTPPQARVLAPPWYLYLSGRRAYDDRYADINLWAQAAATGDSAARALAGEVVVQLRRRALPLVVADQRVARLPGLEQALRRYYRRVPFRDDLPADRAVTLWVP